MQYDTERLGDSHPVALVFAGLVPVLFSFGGWQQALWIGGEVRDPERNIPRAIIVGVLLVVCVYMLTNWCHRDSSAAFANAFPWTDHGRFPSVSRSTTKTVRN